MYYHCQEFLKIVYHMHDKLAIIKRYLLFRSRETIQYTTGVITAQVVLERTLTCHTA